MRRQLRTDLEPEDLDRACDPIDFADRREPQGSDQNPQPRLASEERVSEVPGNDGAAVG